MVKIKKYILIILCLLLISCNSYYDNSLNSLLKAFDSWYLIQNPEISNSLNPKDHYVKNNNMQLGYLNEYALDLKRFRLELMQIDKDRISERNFYLYSLIEDKINTLLFNHNNFKYYGNNPSYYYNKINNHLLQLLIDKSITDSYRNDLLLESLDLFPVFLKQISKNTTSSNDFFIDRSNYEIRKTIEIMDNIPIYIESNSSTLEIIESKIDKNKKYFKETLEWLNNDLNNDFKVDKEHKIEIYDNRKLLIESKYQHKDILHSLDLTITNLQNNIFDLSLPIYLQNNDIPIWANRDDTLNVINYVLKNKFNNKKIELDNASKLIKFNSCYDSLLSFINKKDIFANKKIDKIIFPHYDMFFKEDDKMFLSNNSYSIKNIDVLFNNSYEYIDDNEIYLFIIKNVLTKHIFNEYNINNHIMIDNDINHYVWGNLLVEIIIDSNPSFLNPDFEIYYNMLLLEDFVKLLAQYNYTNGNVSKDAIINLFFEKTFMTSFEDKNRDSVWQDILYNDFLNLEHYAAYIYAVNLYHTYSIIDNKLSAKKIIKKFFENGFIPVYNYKAILN